MPSDQDKPTRWRPRFSVRTLVVIVTVVCAYAACWGPTKKWGVGDVVAREIRVDFADLPPHAIDYDGMLSDATEVGEALLPLVVETSWLTSRVEGDVMLMGERKRYYLWFFGHVAKLPYERKYFVPPPARSHQSP